MLEGTGFVLEFAESGNRQSETVRCQRFEQQSLDCSVDAQGSHLLAAWSAILMLVGATKIDRVVAARPRIMQSHPAAATATNAIPCSNALPRRGTPWRCAP